MADERKAFLLRVDPSLWKELERWAADELRSVNGQIEFVLREAVRRGRRPGGEPPRAADGEEAGRSGPTAGP
jgi:hypothetical protein